MRVPVSPCPEQFGPPVGFEAVRDQLKRILSSAAFADSERLCALLSFLVEQTLLGHGDELKESVAAVEVFGRAAGFDPKSDSLVRVQMRNLRRRLDQYYAGPGSRDPVRIELPRGTYVPEFRLPAAAGLKERKRPIAWPKSLDRRVALVAMAALPFVAGFWWWLTVRAAVPETGSVAVMPFSNVGGGAGNEYLADGFADELISVLERRPGLRVAARSLAFQFKGTEVDARAVAARLQVASVLEGTIQPEGDRLKVTARLVNGRTGKPVWAQSFDRPAGEAGAILDGIERGATAALKVAAPPEKVHLPAPEIQELYLRAVWLRGQRDTVSREQGFQYLEQVASRDPAFAPGLSAFAIACAGRCYHAAPHREKWAAKARESAWKALAADGTDPKAHAALGWLNWFYERDWPAAETEFRRALQLNPNYAGAHNLYALGLTTRGRFAEALAEARRAREIDPLTYVVSTDLVLVNFLARRFDEAEKLSRSLLSVDRGYAPAHLLIGECLAARRQYTGAVRELRLIDTRDDVEFLGRLGFVLARTGDRAAALDAARRISELNSGGDVCGSTALVYAGLGDHDKAFEWLNKAADRRETSVIFAGVDPFLDELHHESRFEILRKRLGL